MPPPPLHWREPWSAARVAATRFPAGRPSPADARDTGVRRDAPAVFRPDHLADVFFVLPERPLAVPFRAGSGCIDGGAVRLAEDRAAVAKRGFGGEPGVDGGHVRDSCCPKVCKNTRRASLCGPRGGPARQRDL